MSTLGRGTMLAGRYRLEERLSVSAADVAPAPLGVHDSTRRGAGESPASSLWRGLDNTLDRQVAIRIISPRTAGEALDAARRAALVDDPRLVRLLDVAHAPSPTGGTATQTYVVSEWIDGQSLSDLLAQSGPLRGEQVRMLIGEAAEALAVAAQRGLHHLALDPTSVLLTRDGAVRVHGLAVTAAAQGGAQPVGAAAERVDAVGLVALIYAGLTGRWPLPTSSHDKPLEIAPMVGNSPVPPSEIVSGVPNDLDTLCSVTFSQGTDGPTSPAELAAQLRPWGSPSASPASNRLLADDLRQTPKRAPSRFPIQLTPVQGQDVIPPAPRRSTTAELFGAGSDEPATTEDPTGTTADSTAAVAATGPSTSAPAPSGPAPTGPAPTGPAPTGPAPTGPGHTESRTRGRDDWNPSLEADHRPQVPEPAPAVAASAGDGGRSTPSRGGSAAPKRRRLLPIVLVAALVVVGLVLAVWSLGGGIGETPPAASSTTQAPTETATSTPGTPPAIAEVTAFDPQGDDSENDAQASLAADGDPSTSWQSSRYNSAAFGNLKDGLGLVVRLEGPANVDKVTVTAEGEGGTVEIRTATGPTLDGSQVVASGPAGTLEKTLDPAPETQYLIIWFTELPQVDGQFRAAVAEVGVA